MILNNAKCFQSKKEVVFGVFDNIECKCFIIFDLRRLF